MQQTLNPTRAKLRQWLRRLRHPAWLGLLRRTRPLSDVWGFDRGKPVDRYYIESFLEAHRNDIRGRVLEVQDSGYTNRFGHQIERREVLDINSQNPQATIIADLAAADSVGSDQFDCFILTQTLHLIYDIHSALRHCHRLLAPNGVLLATLPAVSRISKGAGVEGDYWRFTSASAQQLFGEAFGAENVTVQTYGNVLTAISFLAGLATEDLSRRELDELDPYFPVIIAVRAQKRGCSRK